VREEWRGMDEREKEEGEERELEDAVSQDQFLDQPMVTMGLCRTVSEKKTSISVKKSHFYVPESLTPPPPA